MWEWISKVGSLQKIQTKYVVGIFTVCNLMLLSEEKFLSWLGLNEFISENKSWVGLFWVVSLIVLIVRSSSWVLEAGKRKWKIKTLKKRLLDLTPTEKKILIGYIQGNTRTLYFDYRSGVVAGLESCNIIYRAANMGNSHGHFAYNIQPWAFDYLRDNSSLLHYD